MSHDSAFGAIEPRASVQQRLTYSPRISENTSWDLRVMDAFSECIHPTPQSGDVDSALYRELYDDDDGGTQAFGALWLLTCFLHESRTLRLEHGWKASVLHAAEYIGSGGRGEGVWKANSRSTKLRLRAAGILARRALPAPAVFLVDSPDPETLDSQALPSYVTATDDYLRGADDPDDFIPSDELAAYVVEALNAVAEEHYARLDELPEDDKFGKDILEQMRAVNVTVDGRQQYAHAKEMIVTSLRDYLVTVADELPLKRDATITLTKNGGAAFHISIEDALRYRIPVIDSAKFFALLAKELVPVARSGKLGNDSGLLLLSDNGELVVRRTANSLIKAPKASPWIKSKVKKRPEKRTLRKT